jgi:hypothetical protein
MAMMGWRRLGLCRLLLLLLLLLVVVVVVVVLGRNLFNDELRSLGCDPIEVSLRHGKCCGQLRWGSRHERVRERQVRQHVT